MTASRAYIGRLEHRLSDVAAEYLALAQEDEKVGQCQGRFTFDPDRRVAFDPPWRVRSHSRADVMG